MVKGATEAGKGPHDKEERPYLTDYLKLGYVPIDKDASAASRTLEYASDDFAIAQFARSLGDEGTYQKLLKQSENWTNLFDLRTTMTPGCIVSAPSGNLNARIHTQPEAEQQRGLPSSERSPTWVKR
jgi:putative alpha-1,2-mannosidase